MGLFDKREFRGSVEARADGDTFWVELFNARGDLCYRGPGHKELADAGRDMFCWLRAHGYSWPEGWDQVLL